MKSSSWILDFRKNIQEKSKFYKISRYFRHFRNVIVTWDLKKKFFPWILTIPITVDQWKFNPNILSTQKKKKIGIWNMKKNISHFLIFHLKSAILFFKAIKMQFGPRQSKEHTRKWYSTWFWFTVTSFFLLSLEFQHQPKNVIFSALMG